MGLRRADDRPIWDYALKAGAVIITKDEDFAERSARETSGPVIVWLRIGNSTNPVLLGWIESRLAAILQLVDQGHRLIEVI